MHNANSERLSERLSTQSIRVLNRMYLERNIQPIIYIYIYRLPKFTSCHNAIMVVTGRAHCSILLYITLQIHSVEHSYGLGGESLRETFTICIMHRSLLAV